MIALTLVCAGLLALTWAIYPAAMSLLSRRRREPHAAAWPALPTVTAVLATRDQPALIQARVADLLATEYPGQLLSVVVGIDPREGPSTSEVGILDPRVRVVPGDPPGGKTATLNAAVRAATGEIVVFADSQQRFAPDAIPTLVEALADATLGAVSGALTLPGDRGGTRSVAEHYWRYERKLRRDEARVHSAVGVSGSIYAMRRERWTPFPPELILDDLYLPMKLVLNGYRVGFADRARATDLRRTDPEQEYRRKVRTLTGNIQLCAWLPGVLNPARNPIWVQFVCHKLLRLLTPYLLIGTLLGAFGVLVATASSTTLAWILGGGVAALAVVSLRPVMRRRLRELALWGLWLQAAVVVATFNGVRGRWNVWR